MKREDSKQIPVAQAIIFTIEGATDALEWLQTLESEWQESRGKNRNGPEIRKKQRIILDAFCVYIGSLFDERSGTHSLVNSYRKNSFIESFRKEKIVQRCILHRNNRSGHQSKKYGFIVPLNEVIESNLMSFLKNTYYLVATSKLDLI